MTNAGGVVYIGSISPVLLLVATK